MPVQDPEGKYEALAKYARDLTEAAREGKLDPVIGRDDEIRRCIQILSRRTKNNPVLIGEPGVGKTAVAEGGLPNQDTLSVLRPLRQLALLGLPDIPHVAAAVEGAPSSGSCEWARPLWPEEACLARTL
jgi:ATP-dependent Clp protease ATP-binding subunit ClpB